MDELTLIELKNRWRLAPYLPLSSRVTVVD